ncbi:hypothetical protein DFH28DRAFT_1001149 [Melampsora americana]|nr:hypothetical protein DFH28DRAFT_1001149 [Melampsora americana]
MSNLKTIVILAIVSCSHFTRAEAHQSTYPELHRRNLPTPALSNTTSLNTSAPLVNPPIDGNTPAANLTSPPNVNGVPLNTPPTNSSDLCVPYPLDQSTWNQFHWDDYLHTFPAGMNISVQEYARQKGAPNFKCGIGENCDIGQICTPVTFPDWYVLLATQHLNMYLNRMYNVLGYAHALTQSIVSSLWIDLFPAVSKYDDLKAVFVMETIAAGIQVLGALFIFVFGKPALLFTATPFVLTSVVSLPFTGFMLASLAAIITAQLTLRPHSISGPLQTNQFDLWSEFNYELSQTQHAAQELLSNQTESLFQSGISSDVGLGQALRNGTFLNPLELKNTFEIQHNVKNATTAIALSKLLKAMDPCDPKDNEAKWHDHKLSHCSANGTLFNIIRTVPHSTKAINDFENARVIVEKYGFNPEHIAEVSFQCQQKYGVGATNRTMTPLDPSNIIGSTIECSFDLPVCDCRREDIAHLRKKGHRTVEVCRKIGGLPI